ncbi:DMT family transporter [Luteibacter sp. PPL201]|uniref:DMT family transporter n=1 Tax=Luteibacter sahnii TaxID=3021977 RepID=A0ABT6BD89_9GAMM|nr:DMT family transporter [Luteibacter sp. PPL193]MDY1549251.1 DMT family transporter [Luteibacter sp. PPL193]
MSPTRKAFLHIHFCVLLWGFTAILGKSITLAAIPLVWWRMLLVSGALLCVPRVWRGLRATPWRLRLIYAGIGVIVALHWLTFYGAIKLANASVAATCIATCPVFLALVEPWIAGRRFEPRELLIGAAVVPGVALVAGGLPGDMRMGLAMGVLSAIFVAFFGALNKRYIEHADALTVTFLELGAGTLFITLAGPLATPTFVLPDLHDGLLVLLLAFGCTLLPFALALSALRHLSAFATQMITNLEPVYAIVLAIPLLGEQRELGWTFYLGVAVILGAVFAHPFLHKGEPAEPSDLVTP